MYTHVLVPISFEADRATSRALALARMLAGTTGRVTLLHVQEAVPSYALGYLPPDYLAESRAELQLSLQTLAGDMPRATAQVIDGHAGRTITDWAKANAVDCIVIASHRPGMQDLLLGSTATTVVRHAQCSVHVVR
jgi:nucleotide-binding universal stress UspA family protein